jgi:hypothetical protein
MTSSTMLVSSGSDFLLGQAMETADPVEPLIHLALCGGTPIDDAAIRIQIHQPIAQQLITFSVHDHPLGPGMQLDW